MKNRWHRRRKYDNITNNDKNGYSMKMLVVNIIPVKLHPVNIHICKLIEALI
jgi:hypothetical protein